MEVVPPLVGQSNRKNPSRPVRSTWAGILTLMLCDYSESLCPCIQNEYNSIHMKSYCQNF